MDYPVTCEDEDDEKCNFYFTYGKRQGENFTTLFVVSEKGNARRFKMHDVVVIAFNVTVIIS